MPSPLIHRHLTEELKDAVRTARVVNLIGPRQVGKITLVRDLFDAGRFVTLDDDGVRAALDEDPRGQLALLMADLQDEPLIIDEAQRSPTLALAIKRIVDGDRRKGQFVLTGSSNVFTTAAVADSLAGRMRTLKLWPLTTAEVEKRPPCKVLRWAIQNQPKLEQLGHPTHLSRATYIDIILAGGFPEVRSLSINPRQRMYRDYVDAIVERDVADVLPIRKSDKLQILIDQMAARTGLEVNIAQLASLLGIRRETVEQYLDVLMKLSLLTKLGAWTSGESKREIKQAKYHFVDTGLVSALRRLNPSTFAPDANPTALGPVLETFVFNELYRAAELSEDAPRLYHWRSADHREIDIVADAGSRLVGIEIKASGTVANEDFKHLTWFKENACGKSKSVTGIVFYLGEHKLRLGERMFALPVSSLWA